MLSNTAFDPALLNVSGAKLTHTGGTGINMTYGPDKKQIVLRTPFLLGFGINTWNGGGGAPQQSITLSFYGQPADEPFYHVLCAMDDWLLQTASQNTWEWLKSKNLPLEHLKQRHKRTVRIGGGGVPNIKFTLKDTHTVFFLQGEKPPLEPERIARHFGKGTVAAAVVQCSGVWVKNGYFGFSWKFIHVMLTARTLTTATTATATAAEESSICMIED